MTQNRVSFLFFQIENKQISTNDDLLWFFEMTLLTINTSQNNQQISEPGISTTLQSFHTKKNFFLDKLNITHIWCANQILKFTSLWHSLVFFLLSFRCCSEIELLIIIHRIYCQFIIREKKNSFTKLFNIYSILGSVSKKGDLKVSSIRVFTDTLMHTVSTWFLNILKTWALDTDATNGYRI